MLAPLRPPTRSGLRAEGWRHHDPWKSLSRDERPRPRRRLRSFPRPFVVRGDLPPRSARRARRPRQREHSLLPRSVLVATWRARSEFLGVAQSGFKSARSGTEGPQVRILPPRPFTAHALHTVSITRFFLGVAQSGFRALGLGPRGRRFDSCHLEHRIG